MEDSAVTIEDINSIKLFSKEFGITLSDADLKMLAEMENKYKDGSEIVVGSDDYKVIKKMLCNMLITNPHESFKDKIWDEPKENAQDTLNELNNEEEK